MSRGGTPHVNTMYFAWTRELDCIWISAAAAKHSRNLRAVPAAAIAVFRAREVPDAHADEAEQVCGARFPAYSREGLSGYRLYRFRTNRIKLFDEGVLGARTFVTARVGRQSVQ